MNLDKLKGHVPDSVIAQLPDTIAKFELNTPLRLAHFLAQAGHESGGFKALNENLNYGAKGLLGIFKKYFPTEDLAKLYERKP
jgi:putative chitinase